MDGGSCDACWWCGFGQGVSGEVEFSSCRVLFIDSLAWAFWLTFLSSRSARLPIFGSSSAFVVKVAEIRLKRSVVGVDVKSTISFPLASAGVGESKGEQPSNRDIRVASAVFLRGTITNRLPLSTNSGWWLNGRDGRGRLIGVGGSGLLRVIKDIGLAASATASDCGSFLLDGTVLKSGDGIRCSASACWELRLRLRRALWSLAALCLVVKKSC